jgi:predicted nucleic acid-binding protein
VPSYCVDASVVLAMLFEEQLPLVDQFWADISETDRLIAAQLLRPECASVIHENVANHRISPQRGQNLVDRLIALPLDVDQDPGQFRRAIELAARFRLSKAYDTQYLAVAELTGAELLTIDGGMRQHAVELRLPHRLLR